jgi:hypothetical protein
MTQVKSLYSGDPDVMCMTVGAIRVKVIEAIILDLLHLQVRKDNV